MSSKIADLFNLEGKVAIVTGAHALLGYDMASALAEAGCNIIITSRVLSRAEDAAAKIRQEYGVETLALTMDHCEYDQVRVMADKAYEWKGRIDVLINNAGGGSGESEGDFLKRSPEAIVSMISTNLIGAMFCCREVGRYLVQQKFGKIINIASNAGLVGRDRGMYHRTNKTEQPVDYAASKAGVIGMTRDLAAYMAPYGVYVNSISPGGFDRGDLPENFVKAYSDLTALGRMGRFGVDLKGAALYLASSASDYMTAHNLVVDGGFSIWK
jgi:NAD(P)-dependent dehydrogenase (short-subunit alcohol dehydrogenase family)